MGDLAEPSICIPRALANVTWRDVKQVFETLFGEGSVQRVDVVKSREETRFCRVFVHVRRWPEEMAATRQKLLDGDAVKIVYNDPWFWRCVKSNVPRPPSRRAAVAGTPYIIDEA